MESRIAPLSINNIPNSCWNLILSFKKIYPRSTTINVEINDNGVLITVSILTTEVKKETPPIHHATAPPIIRNRPSFLGGKNVSLCFSLFESVLIKARIKAPKTIKPFLTAILETTSMDESSNNILVKAIVPPQKTAASKE